jgi:predicted RNase H-like HicB family nuclease
MNLAADGHAGLAYIPRSSLEPPVTFRIELEQEADGRWIAEIGVLPGVMAYGVTQADALARVQALALRVLAERLEHGEAAPEYLNVSFAAA